MKFFHFTRLLSLPQILREGITIGEVPTSPDLSVADRPNAANLTTDGSLRNQLWNAGGYNKMALRLIVEIPKGDVATFQEVAERFGTSPEWADRLGTPEQRRHWFYAFGGVKPDQIVRVERLVKGKYCQQSAKELTQLTAAIEKEMEKILVGVVESGPAAGALSFNLKPGYRESWLLQMPDV